MKEFIENTKRFNSEVEDILALHDIIDHTNDDVVIEKCYSLIKKKNLILKKLNEEDCNYE